MHHQTTISILEGTPLYRSLVKQMVMSISGYRMDHMFDTVDEAQVLLSKSSDVVIIDVESGGAREVFPFMRRLTQDGSTRCIACSMSQDDYLIRQAFLSGAIGYIVKESDYREFRTNLLLALTGGMPLSRSVTRRLVEGIRRDCSSVPGSRLSAPVSDACRIIDDVLSAPYVFQSENLSNVLSRRIGMSYHHLSLLFRKQMGVPLSQYVIGQKVERVKCMIREDNYSLTQIAYKMDYSSVAHLSAQFRKATGVTPSEFKRMLLHQV